MMSIEAADWQVGDVVFSDFEVLGVAAESGRRRIIP